MCNNHNSGCESQLNCKLKLFWKHNFYCNIQVSCSFLFASLILLCSRFDIITLWVVGNSLKQNLGGGIRLKSVREQLNMLESERSCTWWLNRWKVLEDFVGSCLKSERWHLDWATFNCILHLKSILFSLSFFSGVIRTPGVCGNSAPVGGVKYKVGHLPMDFTVEDIDLKKKNKKNTFHEVT